MTDASKVNPEKVQSFLEGNPQSEQELLQSLKAMVAGVSRLDEHFLQNPSYARFTQGNHPIQKGIFHCVATISQLGSKQPSEKQEQENSTTHTPRPTRP